MKVFRNHLKLVSFSRKLACRSPTLGINKRPEAGENVSRKRRDGKKQEVRLQMNRLAAFLSPPAGQPQCLIKPLLPQGPMGKSTLKK